MILCFKCLNLTSAKSQYRFLLEIKDHCGQRARGHGPTKAISLNSHIRCPVPPVYAKYLPQKPHRRLEERRDDVDGPKMCQKGWSGFPSAASTGYTTENVEHSSFPAGLHLACVKLRLLPWLCDTSKMDQCRVRAMKIFIAQVQTTAPSAKGSYSVLQMLEDAREC